MTLQYVQANDPIVAWWFSAGDVLPHGDGRPIVVGERLGVKGKLVLCQNALHWSRDPFDALHYALGDWLHKVHASGHVIEYKDKGGSRYRTVIARKYARDMLRAFARRQALSVIGNWNAPDVVREWLETGNEMLREAARSAAWSAAMSAAQSAALSAAWSAALSAAWSAAQSEAWSAALSAAQGSAWSAAENAAWNAALSAARQMFNEMVAELFTPQPQQ